MSEAKYQEGGREAADCHELEQVNVITATLAAGERLESWDLDAEAYAGSIPCTARMHKGITAAPFRLQMSQHTGCFCFHQVQILIKTSKSLPISPNCEHNRGSLRNHKWSEALS